MKVKSIFLALLTFSSFSLFSTQDSFQKEMLQELKVLKQSVEMKYAPKEWKQKHLGWNLEDAYQQAKQRILNEKPQTTKAYQKIIKEFLGKTYDYHVGIYFFSTEKSFFPINIKKAEGRYFYTSQNGLSNLSTLIFGIDEFDMEKFIFEFEQLNFGDEILALNGIPIHKHIEKIIDEKLQGNRCETSYAYAAKLLFIHSGSVAHDIPTGTFTLTFLHDQKEKTITLPWLHIKEWVNEPAQVNRSYFEDFFDNLFSNRKQVGKILSKTLAKDYSVSMAKDLKLKNLLKYKEADEEQEEQIDVRVKGFLPELGKVVWESKIDEELYAYLYENDAGQKIGYLHIPDFMPFGVENMMDQLVEALTYFNEESEALVLDLTDNPGGDLIYGYAILSTLTDYPLICPKQKETLIQEDIFQYALAQNILELTKKESDEELQKETINGLTITHQLLDEIKAYTNEVLKLWESGERLTPELHILGISEIAPHPKVQYKKPIMLLINELDLSCGDFIPSVLQDNHRATLFGKKTGGAGGYVKFYSHMSRLGIAGYTLTGSIATRVNGEVIENLGITPDIPYELTVRDMKEDYADYAQTLNKEVKKLIDKV